jgi:fibro-slime domain-containing protein
MEGEDRKRQNISIISIFNSNGFFRQGTCIMNKLLILLTLVLLLAENAVAACDIKLHVRAPGGADWSYFYVVFGTGTSEASPATEDRIASGAVADAATGAGWYVADLNGLNADTPNQGFLIIRSNNGQSKIGGDYNVTTATNFLACPAGAAGEDWYLSEDPANPGRSILSTTPTSSDPDPGGSSSSSGPGGSSNSSTVRTFYFLPPNDPEWISATPYFWLDVPGQPQQPQRMSIDATRCGWYKAEFAAGNIPSGDAYILRASSDFTGRSTYRIGLLGLTEDPADWSSNGFPTPFDFSKQFSEISSPAGSRNLFFVSEKGTWSATDPMINEKERRCSYNFAAIIYDTDREVNCSFNPNNGTTNWAGSGFKKGIVQPTLDANRKLQFNASAATDTCSWANESSNTNCRYTNKASAPRNCIAGWNQQNFSRAWNATDTTNVVRCYDMPFQRSSAGLWEFNSNKLCRNGNVMDLNGNCSSYGGYLGGFFPDELQTRGTGDYSKCPDCDKKYSANGWQALSNNVNPWCYERAWRGTGTGTGNLSGAQTADQINTAMSSAGCTAELNGSTNNLYSNTYNPSSVGSRNFFFCFESHANFTYEPGQEFFFSGDDDVWIFINNRLALDLGGVHSAVPGYIKLDTIKTPAPLVRGEVYPIDIFFCERNLNQSNIRITTNMYFSQESSMYLKTANAEVVGDVCIARSGTGSSCQEVASGGSKQDTLCGADLLNNLKYYIANRAGTAGEPLTSLGLPNINGIVLDTNNPYCKASTDATGAHLLCYGGIKIYEAAGKVQVLPDEVVGLVGTWRVWLNYVGPVNPKPPSMRVAEFTKNARVRVVWGTLFHSITNAPLAVLDTVRSASTMAGKLVKVAFAVAAEESPRVFKVGMDRYDAGYSPGTQFTIAGSSFSGISLKDSLALPKANLRVFADSLAQVEHSKDMVHVIPPEGYLVLWVTGNSEAGDDARYSINASGSTTSLPFELNVYQPRSEVGLFLQSSETGSKICLQETENSEPICGTELASLISYSLVVPDVGSINLDSAASGCIWESATNGVCYGGIALNNGVVNIDENSIPDYLRALGFEIYVSVSGLDPLNVSKTEPIDPSSSIAIIPSMLRAQESVYYNIKGEPLGKQKPKRAGVYIVRQNGVNKMEVVK